MNFSYPHREPLVVRHHELRVVRRFRADGDVKARAGERIAAAKVLARADAAAAAVRIPIADQLGVAPHDAAKHLMRPIGSPFAQGEALARTRKGLRNVVVAAPVAGTLLAVDGDTGIGLIAPHGAGEVRAMVAGDVEYVDGRQSVSIRTVGSRLLGVVGLGEPVEGVVHLLVDRPDAVADAARIGPEVAGKIAVAGAAADAPALKRLAEVGAVAVVTGGLLEAEIGAWLGHPGEDRLAPWRQAPGEQPFGAGLPLPLALMATEGFGRLPLHPDAFALLGELAGQRAVLFPRTRVVGALARPELIVVDEIALDEDGQTSLAALHPGARVRLVDQANLGKAGTVVGEPRRARRADGLQVDVVDVELKPGGPRAIPIANLEVVAR